ncbi:MULTISPECIES: YozE family protein [unclassified Streptomyces]|uniref:YozE family protein n=1 Tax=unclassified Streptomyces TaxID=2593676 RepID=UPI00131B6B7E|nr:YozE family protein [Streptomyces sp. CB01373]
MNDTDDFTRWLTSHTDELNRLGSLARSVANDPQWPVTATIETYREYLESRGAAPEVIDTLSRAWSEFEHLHHLH